MADPKPLRRDQLAKFLPDEETIRRFERLFEQAGKDIPANVVETDLNASSALSLANSALEQLEDLRQYVDNNLNNSQALEALQEIESLKNIVLQITEQDETDYIDFNLAPYAEKERRLSWDDEFLTFNAGLINGKQLKLGQDVLYCVKNTSGATINKGQSVMATGVVGASAKITAGLAVADGSVNAMYMLGIAAHDILDNDFGYVLNTGKIKGIDTTGSLYGETWVDGDILHFNPNIAGGLTKVDPVAPDLNLPIAIVLNASAGSGSILVRMKSGEYLNELHDVAISSPTNGQVLKYNSTSGVWENGAASGGSATYSVTLSVTPAQYDEAIINVIDANSTALSYISCFLVPNADNDLDDLIGVDVKAEAKAGSIDFMLHSDGAIVGDYQVVYQILG